MRKLGQTTVELAKITESDLEEFYRIAKNEEVKQFVKILYPEDMEEAEIIIEMLTVDSNYIAYKILNEKEKFVGVIIGEKKGKGTVEISYFIAEEYRGKGYCTQAVVRFKQLLKKQKYKKMEFSIDLRNKKSQNVMKRLRIPLLYTSRLRIYALDI